MPGGHWLAIDAMGLRARRWWPTATGVKPNSGPGDHQETIDGIRDVLDAICDEDMARRGRGNAKIASGAAWPRPLLPGRSVPRPRIRRPTGQGRLSPRGPASNIMNDTGPIACARGVLFFVASRCSFVVSEANDARRSSVPERAINSNSTRAETIWRGTWDAGVPSLYPLFFAAFAIGFRKGPCPQRPKLMCVNLALPNCP